MAKVVGDIAVRVGADVSGLQDGMKKCGKSLKCFESDAAQMGAKFAKIGLGIATVAAGIAVAIGKMASSAGETAREIQNLSTVAGTGVENFQRLAAGAKTVGIEQEKLADIFKDVNDKFGDFMATGAGPLADFFENIAPAVGVTAEQFAKLSGPEALQLYVTSLERAGVSQQQMTFYMEALASDATALVPLLANNGREMRRYGDEAERTGRIISSEMVASGVEMDRKLKDLADTLRTQATQAVLEYSDEIIAAADFITGTLLPAIDQFITDIAAFAESMQPAIDALSRFLSLAQAAAGVEVGSAQYSAEDQARLNGDIAPRAGEGDPSSTGQFYVDENGNVQEYGNAPSIPGITAPEVKPIIPTVNRKKKTSGGGKKGSGGGGSGLDREDLEALQQRYMEESELILAQQEDALEKLREFREKKIATEEEYNALEADIKAEHQEQLAKIEREAQQQRLQAFSGALGDLASLMQSGNEKLFKVGQAAAVADAVVNGYSAAVAAWEKGMKIGGPPVAASFTAASIAKTGALIAGIKSASSSGSTGAATTSGTASGAAAAPQERRVAEFRFTGGNVLDPSAIVDAMNEAYDQGYQIRGVIG